MELRINDKISIEGSILKVETFFAFRRRVDEMDFDLNSDKFRKMRGKKIYLFINNDYDLTFESKPIHKWLLAEIELPKIEFEEHQKLNAKKNPVFDKEGNPVMIRTELPMVLDEKNIKLWDLPPSWM